MRVTIVITKGQGTAKKVSAELPVIVGRSPDVGVSIVHPAVSREHCELSDSGGFVKIRDLGSTNGTRVGGKKVPEAVLRPHGKFSIGPLSFQVDYQYVGEATQFLGDIDEEEDEAEDLAVGGNSGLIRPGAPAAKPSDDWIEESDDVYGLAIESEAPAAAEATPLPTMKPKPAPAPAARPAEEPRRGDFMRTAKSPQKRLPDAPAPAAPAKGPDRQRDPATNPLSGDAPQAAKPQRKPAAAASAPAAPDRPFDLERELDEMLAGLQGVDLNEFLKGIL